MNVVNDVGTNAVARSTPNQFSQMSSEEFIKIIFTELSNQDPFEPTDSAALLQQLSSIRSIESDVRLTQQLQSLVQENQLSAAGNLIGKVVGGLTEDFQRVAGWVVSIHREGSDVYLELDTGWLVPMSGVETIFDPDLLDGNAPPPPPDSDDVPDDTQGNDNEADLPPDE